MFRWLQAIRSRNKSLKVINHRLYQAFSLRPPTSSQIMTYLVLNARSSLATFLALSLNLLICFSLSTFGLRAFIFYFFLLLYLLLSLFSVWLTRICLTFGFWRVPHSLLHLLLFFSSVGPRCPLLFILSDWQPACPFSCSAIGFLLDKSGAWRQAK